MAEVLSTSFVAALMFLVAIICGYIAKWVRIPRIVALIIGGIGLKIFIGMYVSTEHTRELVLPLRFVNEIALGLILFIIGGVFETSRLKSTRGLLRKFSFSEIGFTAVLTAVGCSIAAWTLPGMSMSLSLSVGLLMACVAIATAPAATWYVLQEYDSKGPNTDHLLVMTGVNNLVSIISFHIIFIIFIAFGVLQGVHGAPKSWWWDIFFVSVGSIGLGLILGGLLSLLQSRLPLREMVLMFFATLFLLSVGDEWMLHVFNTAFSPMITCLIMGVVFSHKARDASPFEDTLETVSMPIFALFFVLAGYNLHLEELPHLGILGIVYLTMRGIGKYIGVKKTVQKLGNKTKVKENAGLGLLCQAGVAVFLGVFLVDHWAHPVATKINAVILASVAIYEIFGPLLVKYVIIGAGEVKAVTLLRPGFLRPTWISPTTEVRKSRPLHTQPSQPTTAVGKSLTAKHLMRSNIHFLPTTANFDDVLDFIERSRFHDFPVVNSEGQYEGMVHFQKVRDQIYNPAMVQLVTAGAIADKETPAATPEMKDSQLFELFHKHNLGEIAVVDNLINKKLLGIIEQRDLLREMHK